MDQLTIALLTALLMLCGFSLYEAYQRQQRKIEKIEAENARLAEENAKLKDASRKHLPYQTMEDLEHAKAAWVLLVNELEFKENIVNNLGAFLDRARADKRAA